MEGDRVRVGHPQMKDTAACPLAASCLNARLAWFDDSNVDGPATAVVGEGEGEGGGDYDGDDARWCAFSGDNGGDVGHQWR